VLQFEREKTLLKEQLSAANSSNNDLEARIAEVKRTYKKEMIDMKNNLNNGYKELLEQYEMEISGLKDQIMNGQSEATTNTEKLELLEEQNGTLKDRNKQLSDQVKELKKEVQSARVEFEKYKINTECELEEAKDLIKENDKLREVIEIGDSKMDKLKDELQNVKD
jgi:chromosome segregation ATPase